MKKIMLVLLVGVLLVSAVSASSVTRSFSATQLNPGDSLDVTLTVVIDGGESFYAIDETIPSVNWVISDDGGMDTTQAGHLKSLCIDGLGCTVEDTTLQYTLTVPNEPGMHDFSGIFGIEGFPDPLEFDILGDTQVEVVVEGDETPPVISNIQANPTENTVLVSWTTDENSDSTVFYGETENLGSSVSETDLVTLHTINFNGLTEDTLYFYRVESCDAGEICAESEINSFETLEEPEEPTDDLMVNYVRGEITIDGEPAEAGTEYEVEVTSGVNEGQLFQGIVDSNIPDELLGNGFYDTLDQIEFSTGAGFTVRLLGHICVNNEREGDFENGGNGDFITGEDLISINCVVIDNEPPVLEEIPNQVVEEDGNVLYFLGADDPDDDDLIFNVIDENIEEVDCDINGNQLTIAPAENFNGDATCEIEVSDGLFTDSQIVDIEVSPVNDAPVLINNIVDITWDQDTDLIDFLDLNDFFFDVDEDDLEFVIASMHVFIDIEIDDGLISFFPEDGFFGSEILVLIASDSESSVFSNPITLTVAKVGEPPVFGELECDLIIDEDMGHVCDLIASDPDDDEFEFSIVDENNLNCNIAEDVLSYVSDENYNGPASCTIRVADIDGFNDFDLDVVVLPVNDAPILDPIIGVIDDEGELIEIAAVANDVDEEDTLVYSINDSERFTHDGEGNFAWQTTFEDSGVYFFEISVDDGNGGEDQEIFQVVINDVNEPPIFNPLPDVLILEDSGFQIVIEDLMEFVSEGDSSIDGFSVGDENVNEVDCSIVGDSLAVEPAEDFFGQASCEIEVFDNDGGSDESIVIINVAPQNDAPAIDELSPVFNPIITEDGAQSFSVIWSDSDNSDDVFVEWFVDGVLAGSGDEFQFDAIDDGEFDIKVVVSDAIDFVFFVWDLIASNIPIVDSYSGDTTDFSGMDDDDLADVDLILEKENGKIEFLESVDLRDTVDFENFADILNSLVAIDTDQLAALEGAPARITLFNLNFDETPTIYHNDGFTLDPDEVTDVCSISMCSNVDYNSNTGTLSFDVLGFSSFKAGDVASCSELGGNICMENEICGGELLNSAEGSCCSTTCLEAPVEPVQFSDINRCDPGILNDNLEINIRDPDDGDEFEPGEVIDMELRIDNELGEDLDFDIDVFLYDVDDEDVIESDDISLDIDDSDSEKIDFDISIDEDIDDSNDYAIFVKVEDEDQLFCNEEFIFIDIDRMEHNVIIDNMQIIPSSAVCGEFVSVNMDIRNIGGSDEDVYITLENPGLRIFERSGTFEIEEFDEDDRAERVISFKIPDDAAGGLYSIKGTVFFDDGNENYFVSEDLVLGSCREYGERLAGNGPIILGDAVSQTSGKMKAPSIERDTNTLFIVNLVLISGIILILIMLLLVRKR